MSPFLDSSLHIRWSTLTPDAIVPDITAALADAEARVDAVCRTDRGRMTFENTFLAFESSTAGLSDAWGKVGHLDAVCNSPALREAYNEMLPKVTAFYTKLMMNEALWDLLKTYADTPEAKALTGVQKRYLEETLADFRGSGADLPPNKKQQLEEIEAELAIVTQKYSENVLDSTNGWELILTDEAQLAGLPDSAKSAALAEAKARGAVSVMLCFNPAMREAVIVSTARTGLAKSVRGSLNATHPIVYAGHALSNAITRAGLEAGEVEDVILGSGHPEGATGYDIARYVDQVAAAIGTRPASLVDAYGGVGLFAATVGADGDVVVDDDTARRPSAWPADRPLQGRSPPAAATGLPARPAARGPAEPTDLQRGLRSTGLAKAAATWPRGARPPGPTCRSRDGS